MSNSWKATQVIDANSLHFHFWVILSSADSFRSLKINLKCNTRLFGDEQTHHSCTWSASCNWENPFPNRHSVHIERFADFLYATLVCSLSWSTSAAAQLPWRAHASLRNVPLWHLSDFMSGFGHPYSVCMFPNLWSCSQSWHSPVVTAILNLCSVALLSRQHQ